MEEKDLKNQWYFNKDRIKFIGFWSPQLSYVLKLLIGNEI